MSQQKPIVTPIALSRTNSATITLPWFVQRTEYCPAQSTFKPLVNGEEAFGEVYDAIAAARRSVDIICWGFQPSMYFKRCNGDAVPIGQLLARKGAEGVRVRLLCWQDDIHMAEWSENNMPGNNFATMAKPHLPDWFLALPGMSMVTRDYQKSFQREFDLEWFRRVNLNNVTKDNQRLERALAEKLGKRLASSLFGIKPFDGIEFATRGFDPWDRSLIAFQTWLFGKDSQRDAKTKATNSAAMGAEPTHHQKMVLVDYELPEQALGFVMGHNMLDTYWDRNDHSYVRMHPRMGRNGEHPRQDISARVTGPVLQYLNRNFCQAWDDATGQSLGKAREGIAKKLQLRRDYDTPVMAQILRTQAQKGKRDIESMYMNAVNNATQFIYIENQYFRFPPLAEKIKAAAAEQVKRGRDPGKHGPIHLFVVTNDNDAGIGAGTVNTYRMLDALGRADTIPGVARDERADKLKVELEAARKQAAGATSPQAQAAAQAKVADLEQRLQANADESKPIPSVEIPGLKVHVCSLVAPDSPPGKWDYVYVHAKLMIVDDVFTTIGSANINTRSMMADSELNICHEHMGVTQPLRRRLWGIHTNGLGAQDDPVEAFEQWEFIVRLNVKRQVTATQRPIASLVGFMRTSKDRSYSD